MMQLPSVWLVRPPPFSWLSHRDSDTDSNECDDDSEMYNLRSSSKRVFSVPQHIDSVPEDGLPEEAATQSLTDGHLADNATRREMRPKPRRAVTTDALGSGDAQNVVMSMSSLSRHSSGQLSDAAIKGHLKVFLADKIHRDYPVVDFVKAVWGLSADDLKKPYTAGKPKDYVLNATACREYIGQVYDKKDKLKKPGERAAYAPLMKIFRDLEKQIKGAYKIKDPDHKLSIVNMKDRKVVGQFAGLKPDIMWGWADEEDRQYWDMSALAGELRKGIIGERASKSFPVFKISLNAFPSFEYGESTGEPSTSKGKRKASAVPATTRNSKRMRSDVQTEEESCTDAEDNVAPSTPPTDTLPIPRPSVPLTPKEIQIAKYLNELASHGVRSYATGVLIEDCDMTLWYMDRMGAVKSTSFNFLKEPHFLVLFIAAITIAPLSRLGFFPMLRFSGTSPDDYKDGILELPPVLDADGSTQSGLRFDVDITDTRQIINTYGAVGRATVIVPVKSRSEPAETCCGSGNLMVKIAWQSHVSKGEDAHIRAIRNAVAADPSAKECLKHIVDMKCSVTRTMQEMDLPRAFMYDLREYHERVCRTLVLVEYMPLNLINSPQEFKAVFVGALRGHHAAYVSASILHRDISTNNIMFYRDDDDAAVGVMCDWDLGMRWNSDSFSLESLVTDTINSQAPPSQAKNTANQSHDSTVHKGTISRKSQSQKADQSIVPQPSRIVVAADPDSNQMPKYRTGTGPFMALDLLLYRQAPHHLYRHDLESFFWVFVWFVTCFDPEKQALGRIQGWLQDTLKTIGGEKVAYLKKREVYDTMLQAAHSDYQAHCRGWIRALRTKLIFPVFDRFDRFESTLWDILVEAQDDNDQDGVDEVMEEIRSSVKAREEILTYESFMKCLGEDP